MLRCTWCSGVRGVGPFTKISVPMTATRGARLLPLKIGHPENSPPIKYDLRCVGTGHGCRGIGTKTLPALGTCSFLSLGSLRLSDVFEFVVLNS